jgi:hypothetical protein
MTRETPRELKRLPVAAVLPHDEVRLDDILSATLDEPDAATGFALIRKISHATPQPGLITWHTDKGNFALAANVIVRVALREENY